MAKIKITLKQRDKAGIPKPADGEVGPIDVAVGSPEWEAICRRCGKCCFELTYDQDDTLIGSTICEFLDPATRLCRVYERRFEVCHDCLRLTDENLPTFDWLPEECGYVVRFGIRFKGKKE